MIVVFITSLSVAEDIHEENSSQHPQTSSQQQHQGLCVISDLLFEMENYFLSIVE